MYVAPNTFLSALDALLGIETDPTTGKPHHNPKKQIVDIHTLLKK